MLLQNLLARNECATLDFKAKWHSNKVKLLHDILCLANAYADEQRFLVFGVEDDKTVVGVAQDPNRRNNADLHDFLRSSNLNRFLSLELRTQHIDGLEVDVVEIANRPDKPFFLTRDKTEQKHTIRAGVTYTRLSETNTPLRECAPEEMLELMWRERFGFGCSPLERVELLLDDPQEWTHESDDYLYHKLFPEFVIKDGESLCEKFSEDWTTRFPDPMAQSFEVLICYHATVLKRVTFVHCDGFRYRIPLPNRLPDNSFTISRSSCGWKIAQIYWQYNNDLTMGLSIAEVEVVA